jgi:UDP-N-acetylglucosamine--N-acetylmuramyl-(pentapeptide) pyrophosphoryl-undecaprenol N-acetylglucosamine transferase
MAVALARELRTRRPETGVLFVGTKRGLESAVLGSCGFELATIEVGGLKRVGFRQAMTTMTRLPSSVWQAAKINRGFAPSVIVGVGGYSSGPVLLAGRLQGYPIVLIEPNAYPGLTNRLLARWVDGAAVAFQEAADRLGGRVRLTGVPVREEFHRITASVSAHGPLRLLVTGGSQGSRAINDLLCAGLEWLTPERVRITHQTGRADFARVLEAYRNRGPHGDVVEFIEDMPASFAASDLVVCRAGASTVAELAAAGRPAVLVPFPGAADDHQRKNALAMARRGAALMLEQEQTCGRDLAAELLRLADDRTELQRMAEAAKSMATPTSTGSILQLLEEAARN